MKHILKLFGIPLFMAKVYPTISFLGGRTGRKQFTPGDGKAPHLLLPVSIADCRFFANGWL